MSMGVLGSRHQAPRRPRLLTGKGKYTDDLTAAGHGPRRRSCAARTPTPGSRGDRHRRGRRPPGRGGGLHRPRTSPTSGIGGVVPVGWLLPDLKTPAHPILAADTVRYVGDGVAVVVAEDRYQAQRRRRAGGGRLRDRCRRSSTPPAPPPTARRRSTTRRRATSPSTGSSATPRRPRPPSPPPPTRPRSSCATTACCRNAIEPRACLAEYDATTGELTLRMTTQNPHVHRLLMTPGVAQPAGAQDPGDRPRGGRRLRLQDPPLPRRGDRHLLRHAARAGRSSGSPTRTRGQPDRRPRPRPRHPRPSMALDEDGKIIGLRVETYAAHGRLPVDLRALRADLPLRHPAVGAVRHPGDPRAGDRRRSPTPRRSTPTAAPAGPRRPIVVERLMDLAARRPRASTRRRSGGATSSPRTPSPTRPRWRWPTTAATTSRRSTRRSRWPATPTCAPSRRGAASRAASCWASACRATSRPAASRRRRWSARSAPRPGLCESAKVRVHPTGTVTVFTGSSAHGQGHETTFAQIVADRLGVRRRAGGGGPRRHRRGAVRHGHLRLAARAAVGGSAHRQEPATRSSPRAPSIAAHLLEAAEDDIEFDDGEFRVKGVAGKASRLGRRGAAGLPRPQPARGARAGARGDHLLRSGQLHLSVRHPHRVVEIDAETGEVEIVRYVAVDDCGNADQPDDRRRPGARRHRPGHRPGAVGARGLRRRTASWSPARCSTTRCRGPTTCRRSSSTTR